MTFVRKFNATKKLVGVTVIAVLFIIIAKLNFATWNVRGLSKTDKQHLAAQDCDRYDVDVIGLQETKPCNYLETTLPGHHKLFLFDQKHCVHGGLGFLVNKRFTNNIISHYQISDRVVYMDFLLQPKTPDSQPCNFRIVNCYSPTNPNSVKNPRIIHQFYDELLQAIDIPARHELFILGDFNAKLGKRSSTDESNGLQCNIGRYGVGRRNENGERLMNFLVSNSLFATNTAFRHSSRHITTRTGWIKDQSTKKSRPYFSQIDYVLCKSRSKVLLTDSRSYAGTKLHSDHKLVCARVDFTSRYKLYGDRKRAAKRYNTTTLVCSRNTQELYKNNLKQQIEGLKSASVNNIVNTQNQFNELFQSVKSAAAEAVGFKKKDCKYHYTSDPIVVSMVEERHKLLQQLNNNEQRDRTLLRQKINRLKNDINKRLKTLKSEHANRLADNINATDDARKMFEAVRLLSDSKKTIPVAVFNQENQFVNNDIDKAEIIRSYFQQHYTGSEPPLPAFVGTPRPLDNPITSTEVHTAAQRLKNGKAVGPDEIPNEFLKHAPFEFFDRYAELVNQTFERHEHVASFSEGYLTPLQKPGKPKGPLKSLRPLCLLNGTRKILSMITLKRIQTQVAHYTGPWQNAYKPGHSCANIVWTQRMLLSVVMEKRWSLHKMGIDMSSAFDTIRRSTIIDLLADAGCSDDDIRLVRYLLSNTKLKIKINQTFSGEFEVTIGAFQGDSLSGNLFTLYLAGSLYHLRAVVSTLRPNPPIADSLLPLEWEYADDVDFVDEDKEILEQILPICKEILAEWNLFVNESKTEFTHFYLADKNEFDDKGEPVKNREPWRKTVSLGSKLCSKEDIKHRCILGNSAFQKYKKVWEQGTRISLETRLNIYEATVVSVIMYNCNSWAAPKDVLSKLDVCHRKHLRQIIGMTYPHGIISNKALYKRCSTIPLSERAAHARWKMLGHILRSSNNSPAQLALLFAVDSRSNMKGRVGRHQTNLFNIICKDLSDRNIYIVNTDNLTDLRLLASDRARWKELL